MTEYTFTTLDLPSLHRRAIGFDRLFDDLNRTFANAKSANNYPPHNVIQVDDTHFVVEVAVAGFKESELEVELKENVLTVKGEQAKPETEPKYVHKGISTRNFTQNFTLADNVEVRGATVQNGILAVALEQMIPEEEQPKKIAITFNK